MNKIGDKIMSTNIGTADIKNFFIQNYSIDKISIDDAKDLGIDVQEFAYANTTDDNYFDLEEIANVPDLLAAFTSAVEKDREAQAKDAEKEKEDESKVQETNQAKN